MLAKDKPGNSYWRGRISTIDLLALISSHQLLSIFKRGFYFFNKTGNLKEEVNRTEPSSKGSLDKHFSLFASSSAAKKKVCLTSKLVGATTFSTTLRKMDLIVTLSTSIECHYAECRFYLLSCWMSCRQARQLTLPECRDEEKKSRLMPSRPVLVSFPDRTLTICWFKVSTGWAEEPEVENLASFPAASSFNLAKVAAC